MQLRALYLLILQVYYVPTLVDDACKCILDDACKCILDTWDWNKLIFVCLYLSIMGSILFEQSFF